MTRKTAFLRGGWFKLNNLGLTLEILHQCGKRVKTKSQKVLGANSYVCRSYRGKTGTEGVKKAREPSIFVSSNSCRSWASLIPFMHLVRAFNYSYVITRFSGLETCKRWLLRFPVNLVSITQNIHGSLGNKHIFFRIILLIIK